jgi:RNA polymerase sigma-70 factor (ECF subfamily)
VSDPSVDSTAALLGRAQTGDAVAQEVLFARYLPALRRWARGRLPPSARDLVDTFDIVQDAALSTLRNLAGLTLEHRGAFMAYLREAVNSKIKDQRRRAMRHPPTDTLPDERPDGGESPLEQAIGREQLEIYEGALCRLSDVDRAVVVGRIELQQSYQELALSLGKPSANAARAAFVRALERLVHEMALRDR